MPGLEQGWRRRLAARCLRVLATLAGILYFLIDVCMLAAVRPLAHRLAQWQGFIWLGRQVDRLGPRTTLVLFLVPLLVLEPAKPVGAYLVAEGHTLSGILLIVAAELLKILTVERLFHRSRDKLLSIAWFARLHDWLAGWLNRARATAGWRYAAAVAAWVVRFVHPILRRLIAATRSRKP